MMKSRRPSIHLTVLFLLIFWYCFSPPLLTPQEKTEKFPRVQRAKTENDGRLRELFRKKKLPYPPQSILLRAFKTERELEVWVKSPHQTYTLLKSYAICATSGVPGPKRREGDLQIPEGFYHIDRFNPWSRFYLSLGINYPNPSDRFRGDRQHPGGDIFIHGACVTIGCIPITDDKIKELYWLSLLARRNGQRFIPVHIYPARLNSSGWRALRELASDRIFWLRFKSLTGDHHPRTPRELIGFWENLKTVYDHFEKTRRLPLIQIDREGSYRLPEGQ